ncbi:MAG: hypothetical protein ACYCO3_07700 [Mycobacteriales bacterium]
MRRLPLRIAFVVGLGLIAAPLVFQMFTRAPGGAQMLGSFQPYMHTSVLDRFQGYLDVSDAAAKELATTAPSVGAARLGLTPHAFQAKFPGLIQFEQTMPGAYRQMTGLLSTIKANLTNYAAVKALPSFKLFPYFFVLPGLFVALAAWSALRRTKRNRPAGAARTALFVLGIALIAAPLIFQMFSRAPKGATMLTQFKPIMNTAKITTVQTYFLDMAGGEGAIRTQLLPALHAAGVTAGELPTLLPATMRFEAIWRPMSAQMTPMLAAMNNNLANFKGLTALPPFSLFPYFFVLPGVILIGLAWAAGSASGHESAAPASSSGAGKYHPSLAFLAQEGKRR